MKMYLEISLLIVALIIIGYLVFHSAGVLLSPVTQQSPVNQVCFLGCEKSPLCGISQPGAQCFFVKLAKTDAEREKGLMFVTQLDKNSGMFFIFDKEGIYPFWMKNTLIPLDMIWIGSNNKIVFIAQNVQPCKTFICPVTDPKTNARYVLEVNAGISQNLDIKIGAVAEIKIK